MLAYADDIALLAPTVRAMRHMLKLCNDYANAFSIVFNATESKCVIVKPPTMCAYTEPNLYTDGNRIEIVNGWPHVGQLSIVSVTTVTQFLTGVVAWLDR